MRVLTVNAGSSSLKLSLLDGDDTVLGHRELDAPAARVDPRALDEALAALAGSGGATGPDAVGHRVVHGGERFRAAVIVDGDVRRELEALTDLAPLHQPKSLAALDAVSAALPDVPAVACFDTAFHATIPAAAATYALPAAWRERWPLRRFGFHGLSHAWVARRVPGLLGESGDGRGRREESERLRIVSCHLGAGASLCAIADGRSVDTTMGFTPLAGLVMATRSGDVDPGLLLWLMEHEAMSEAELAHALEHESGLAGLAGTADMRELLARADGDDDRARLAVDVYVHRLAGAIAAMAASLGGLDVLAFTGGIGERSAPIRAACAERLAFLGVGVDAARNAAASGDALISPDDGGGHPALPVAVAVLAAREDAEIARQVRALLGDRP